MTTETMTIHRALVELKTIGKRIDDTIYSAKFCAAVKHGAKLVEGRPVDVYLDDAVSSYDKVSDLIARYNAIKSAVSKSNAVTNVEIGGKVYTVAEAIAMKQHGMEFWISLRDTIKEQLNDATVQIQQNNARLDSQADDFISNVYGGKEAAKGIDPAAIDQARKSYIESRQYELVDGLGSKKGSSAQDTVKKLDDMISSFENEADSVLSVSNSVTTIEISY